MQHYLPNKVSKLLVRFAKVKQWRQRNEDFLIGGKALSKRISGEITDGWQVARGVVGLTAAFAMGVSNAGGLGRMMAMTPPPDNMVAALENMQNLVNEGLRLMTTEEDHIGWAHPAAKLGDKLFLLQGCSMPAILRPSQANSDAYAVVDHAYVQGVMNGEVWSGLSREQLQEIVLS